MGRFITRGSIVAACIVGWASAATAARPGPGDGYDEGATLLSHPSAGGNFRVWYVVDTDDAVPGEDVAPADGVPDYVAEVAAVAEESRQVLIEDYGYRAPLVDADYLPAEEVGGDGRMDIYLLDFGAADGAFAVDGCTDGSSGPSHCLGYMMIENDFAETDYYPSTDIAIRVVVSHEYFHGVQNAYAPGQDIKWTEGSAVWVEELIYPEQDDYENLIRGFLQKPFRAFDRPSGPTFGDPYPYGVAIWATFLAERYGVDTIRQIWLECEGDTDYLAAIERVLADEYGDSLSAAWFAFSQWNLFTGERADPERAYASSDTWASVALEELLEGDEVKGEYAMEGLSARYVPIALSDIAGEMRTLSVSADSLRGIAAQAFIWDGDKLGTAMDLAQGTPREGRDILRLDLNWQGETEMYVMIVGIEPGIASRRVALSLGPVLPDEPDDPDDPDDPMDDPDDDGDGGGCRAGTGSNSLGSVLLLLLLSWLGRRQSRRRRSAAERVSVASAAVVMSAVVALWAVAAPALAQDVGQAETDGMGVAEVNESEGEAGGGADADAASEGEGGDVAEDIGEDDGAWQDEGEVIVITGSRIEQPLSQATVATEVVSRTDIESSGATNVADLLAVQPGLEIVPGLRGVGVRMQGLDPAYVAVFIDGRRVIGRIDGTLDLEGISVGDIERIEIVKGASSALYGSDALAGVIHIITRQPERPLAAEVKAQYGSLGTMDLYSTAGTRQGRWSTRLSAGWREGDGYDLTPDTVNTTGAAYEEMQFAGNAATTLGDIDVGLRAEYLRRDLFGVDEVPGGAVMAVFDNTNIVEQASASADVRWPVAQAAQAAQTAQTAQIIGSARYSLYRDQFLQDQRGSNDGDQYEETMQHLGELSLQYATRLASVHDITAGVDGELEDLSGERIGDGAESRYRIALFAQDDWKLFKEPFVRLAVGGRADVDSQFGFHATPKIALRWDPVPQITGRLGYGWGYRAPDFKQLYLEFDNPGAGYRVRGNPDLQPESSQSLTAGVEARVMSHLWMSLSGFYNDIDDLITIDLVSEGGAGELDRFGYVNASSAFTRGIEAHMRVHPNRALTLDGGYTLTDTRDQELDRALPGRARHQGSLSFMYNEGPVQGTLRGRWVGERAFFRSVDGAEVEEMAEPYLSVDARMAFSLPQGVMAFFGVNNVLDAGSVEYLPIAPRTAYAGAQIKY